MAALLLPLAIALSLPSLAPSAAKYGDASALIALMAQDKKVQDGKLRFILAHGIGRAFVTDAVDPAMLREVLVQSR